MQKAFTLIELLIVVAIIAILAAIAVPNFMEAQTRAKVSRAKNDLRTISVGLEAYATDNAKYPFPGFMPHLESLGTVLELSTPVPYLTSVAMLDTFTPTADALPPPSLLGDHVYVPTYWYENYSGWYGLDVAADHQDETHAPFAGYCIASIGPDRTGSLVAEFPYRIGTDQEGNALKLLYEPTNGTKSSGDIARWTGKPQKFQN
jgi:prepilin-type N-terminal cleavage/methylation domain-containing protein